MTKTKNRKFNNVKRFISFVIAFVILFQSGISVFAMPETERIQSTLDPEITYETNKEEEKPDLLGELSYEISTSDEKQDIEDNKSIIEEESIFDEKEKIETVKEKQDIIDEKISELNEIPKIELNFKREVQNRNFADINPMEIRASVPSTFSLIWLEGGFNTSSRQEGIISGEGNSVLDITPYENEKMRPAIYQLNFTMGGDRDAAPGEVEIRIPKNIFFGRDGEPVGTIKIPLAKRPDTTGATNFHYYEDGDDIVFTNYETFLRTESLTVALEYDFWPYQVEDGYINPNILGTVSIKQDEGIDPILADTNPLEVRVHTKAKLRSIEKFSKERYDEWQDIWGEKPADADEYFYNMWEITMRKPQNNTQPYEVKYVDIADPIGDVVAYSDTRVLWIYKPPTSWTLNKKDFDGTDSFSKEVFFSESNPKNRTEDTKIYTNIITRYKKDLAIDGKRFNNQIIANLTGIDGAQDTKTATSYFTYKPPAQYVGDAYYTNKGRDSGIISESLINALESGNSVKPLGSKNYTFSIKAEGSRMYGVSESGEKDYTLEVVDNIMGLRQYEINGKPANPWFVPVEPNVDYNYVHFYVNYTEFDYKYNITTGYSRVESIDYASYKPVELYIQVEGSSVWQKLGEFVKTGKYDTSYKFTDISGAETRSVGPSKPILIPENTTNIKMVYTGNKYSASIDGRFGIQINPTEKVKSAINEIKNANEKTLQFYNINTMAIKDSEGKVVNEKDKIADPKIKNIINNSPETGEKILAQANEFTGNSGKYLDHGAFYVDLEELVVNSQISKINKTPVSDVQNGREIVDYSVLMSENIVLNKDVISPELAAEWGLVSEQNSGIFYDLLPKGTWALRDTIKAYTIDYYYSGWGGTAVKGQECTHKVEFFPDWENSGRTMMKITVKAPMEHNIKNINFSTNSYFRFSGFFIDFSVANTWDNILDNGKTMLNSVAYETGEGVLAKGQPDIDPNTNIEDKNWFHDVNGNNDPDDKKFLYAQNRLNLTPIIATEIGFTKKVKAIDEPVFGTLSEVPVGGEYVYRLRFAVNKNTQSKNVILYDVLENAYGSNEHWQGTFNRVDLSATREKNIAPVVYYSTRNDLNPRDNPSDGDITNGDIWTTVEPSDKTTIKAVAIDLSKNTAGNEYIFPAEAVLPIYIYMDAPKGGVPSKVPPIYTYNDSYIRGTNIVGTGVNVDLNEKTDIVRVHLREIEMAIEKSSNPESGTFESPTDIRNNDNKLSYTLRITDKSTRDIARNVVVEDILPNGLVIDEEIGISFAFGNNGDSGKLSDAKTIKFVQNGQKLTFTIEKLYEENYLELTIPVKVDPSQIPGNFAPIFQNQAIITNVGGREYEVVSNSTYHKTELPVDIVAKKVWDGNNPYRPGSVTVSLLSNGAIYGEKIVLNENNSWQYKWENLPYSDENGKPIVYSVEEDNVPEYITEIQEEIDLETGEKVFKVINKFKTTDRTVRKIWDDNGRVDKRPDFIIVQLLQDGISYGDSVELSDSNSWSYTWENLPQIIDEDNLHIYTIEEVPVDGYETIIKEEIDPETNGLYFEITNKYKTTSRYVKKQWDDRGDELKLRPESVVVNLLANGEPIGEPVILNSDNNWSHEWSDLEIMDEDDFPINYTVRENFVNHYKNEIETVISEPQPTDPENPNNPEEPDIPVDPEDPVEPENPSIEPPVDQVEGFIVTNILEFTERTVLKIWDDEDDKLEKRPDSITVQLFQDGIAYGDPVELNEENGWHYSWNYLSATNGQNYYDYSIEEIPVDGYSTKIETIFVGDDDVENESTERAYIITNTIIKPPTPVEDTISIVGRKLWVGGPDRKPDISLQLLRNGETFRNSVVLQNGEESYRWDDLDAKDDSGRAYVYSIRELEVPLAYSSKILENGLTVVNVWNDTTDPTPPTPVDPWWPWEPPITPPVYPVEPPMVPPTQPPVTPPVLPPVIIPEDPTVETPIETPVVPEAPTTETKPAKPTIIPKTGDNNMIFVYGGILILAIAVLSRVIYKRNKGR